LVILFTSFSGSLVSRIPGAVQTGIFSVEGSIGKDGFGGSFRVGGGIGASIRQSENSNNQPEINGSGSTELISWPIKKD
ncbi:hypothetical protein L0V04_005614, partial [Escherichia coli]|nr:hypothetical protein [Escherichia coli]